jgi:hypothetical protein
MLAKYLNYSTRYKAIFDRTILFSFSCECLWHTSVLKHTYPYKVEVQGHELPTKPDAFKHPPGAWYKINKVHPAVTEISDVLLNLEGWGGGGGSFFIGEGKVI